MKKNYIKADTLDKKFDSKKDILKHLDINKATRPGLRPEKINVSFPSWMLKSIDHEAKKTRSDKGIYYKTTDCRKNQTNCCLILFVAFSLSLS